MKKNKNRGFTLVELLAVIVIFGMLLVIGTISVSKVMKKSKREVDLSNAKIFVNAINSNILENDDKTTYALATDKYYQNMVEGTKPDDGAIVIKNNKVVQAKLCYNNHDIYFIAGKWQNSDTNNYCNYDDDAIITGNSKTINFDKLDEKTQLYGEIYTSSELVKKKEDYLKQDNSSYGLISPTSEQSKDGEEEINKYLGIAKSVSSNKKYNVEKMVNSSELLSSYKKDRNFSYYSNQNGLPICWAHANANLVSEMMYNKNGKNLIISPKQMMYFKVFENFDDFTLYANPYMFSFSNIYAYNFLDNASGYMYDAPNIFSTGLSPIKGNEQDNKVSHSNFLTNKSNYIITGAQYSDVGPGSITVKQDDPVFKALQDGDYERTNEYKRIIVNNGGIVLGLCAKHNKDAKDEEVKASKVGDSFGFADSECGAHAVMVYGYDDNYTFKDGTRGAFLAKNSWGDGIDEAGKTIENALPKLYISYKYYGIYYFGYTYYNGIIDNDYDNVYDTINNVDYAWNSKTGNNKYVDKINGNEEIIKGVSTHYSNSSYASGSDLDKNIYIYDSINSNQCSDLKLDDMKIVNNNLYDNSNNIKGIVFNIKETNGKGYVFTEVNNGYKFKNGFCILNYNQDQATIYTNNSKINNYYELVYNGDLFGLEGTRFGLNVMSTVGIGDVDLVNNNTTDNTSNTLNMCKINDDNTVSSPGDTNFSLKVNNKINYLTYYYDSLFDKSLRVYATHNGKKTNELIKNKDFKIFESADDFYEESENQEPYTPPKTEGKYSNLSECISLSNHISITEGKYGDLQIICPNGTKITKTPIVNYLEAIEVSGPKSYEGAIKYTYRLYSEERQNMFLGSSKTTVDKTLTFKTDKGQSINIDYTWKADSNRTCILGLCYMKEKEYSCKKILFLESCKERTVNKKIPSGTFTTYGKEEYKLK